MQKRATVKTYNFVIVLVALLFFAAIGKLSYVVLSEKVDGINLKEKSDSITTASKTLYASRGSIFDVNGDPFATTVNSYTLLAYLSPSRTTNEKNPQHVVDKEYTAKQLATVLDMKEEDILTHLKQDKYQTQFGTKGTGLTERTKKQIEELELPGIDFITSTKRYYDMSTFASYIVGYAKKNENDEIIGELGIEMYYDDILSGQNGSTKYQKYTSSDYQIPNTPSTTVPAKNGSDIYLTIDSSIQFIAEEAVKKYKEYDVDWAIFNVMDAKTGAIVASATYPNFNPNDTNTIKSYLNPLLSNQYEPGSVMKTFSWATAIEEGVYNGSDTYKSGSIEVADVVISDANKKGWGTITYDTGFAYSSNVAATKLAVEKIGMSTLTRYYENLGFGKKTGIELANEYSGDIEINYLSELANASFGQGVSVTPIQMLQALSSMTNDGNIIKPYIVDKIVDADGNITYKGERTVVNNVFSTKTVEKMHELMHNVIYNGSTKYWIVPNVNLMGKTGTAQIASPSGGYLKGTTDYIKSFAGIFPADEPKYIVYVAAKKFNANATKDFAKPITTAIESIANHAKLTENINDKTNTKVVDISNYISKETNSTVAVLENKNIDIVTIGNGKYIINQYPLKNNTILSGGKLFLLTNGSDIKVPDMTGWGRSDVQTYCNLAKLSCEIEGYGFVKSQSIEKGTVINSNTEINFELEF